LNAVKGERADLLERADSHARDVVLLTVLEKVVVDLAGAKDDPCNLVGGVDFVGFALRDDALEPGLGLRVEGLGFGVSSGFSTEATRLNLAVGSRFRV
jgi:hypothetical protein